MTVSGLAIDDRTQTPVVILREREGQRMLPIWIGPSEASAIAMELTGRKFQRPLTHDLLKTVIDGLGAKVPKVAIVDLREKTYFAKVYLERDDEVLAIDARPSDCIALALRTKSPIFVREELLRADDSAEEANYEQSMEELQRQLEEMDPDEFGKLWS
ncbi:MAG: bifunctional nuclease family protein [bacterium]|nr:bifunctional nuclease family protein [Gemmatimonadota bacterium]